MSDPTPTHLARRVTQSLACLNTGVTNSSPYFTILKLPAALDGSGGNTNRLRHLVVEYCIQPLGREPHQAIWWTSYVVVARPGTLIRETGYYDEWDEFGIAKGRNVAPRTSDILIADISKGVLNGNQSNGTVLRVVDLSETQKDSEIFAVLVTIVMHDGKYELHGQATLEFSVEH